MLPYQRDFLESLSDLLYSKNRKIDMKKIDAVKELV